MPRSGQVTLPHGLASRTGQERVSIAATVTGCLVPDGPSLLARGARLGPHVASVSHCGATTAAAMLAPAVVALHRYLQHSWSHCRQLKSQSSTCNADQGQLQCIPSQGRGWLFMSNGLLMRRRLSSKMDLRLTEDDGMAVLAMALLVFQGTLSGTLACICKTSNGFA